MKDVYILFPIVWLDGSQRNYESRFSKNLSAIQDRYGFGASFDINPEKWLQVNLRVHGEETLSMKQVEMVFDRVTKFLERQRKLGVIA